MARELFVYWKVPAPQAAAAIGAARAVQDALAAAHPGLQVQLFQRADDAPGDAQTVTVMETYARAAGDAPGIDAGLQACIEAAAAAALAAQPGRAGAAGFAIGPRHVEVFDRLAR